MNAAKRLEISCVCWLFITVNADALTMSLSVLWWQMSLTVRLLVIHYPVDAARRDCTVDQDLALDEARW